MTVNGIIAEYNPFHNGHAYQIQKAKEITGADYTIVIMSGNFMQRGEPALVDKSTRAAMALSGGADLVLELPVCYSTASAETFAHGAVSLMTKLGVVTHLCFGSECGNLAVISRAAGFLIQEPETYVKHLKALLKSGLSYPAARQEALLAMLPEGTIPESFLNAPNNILGIEYYKALQRLGSPITPVTVLREGGDHNDTSVSDEYASAKALRSALKKGETIENLSGAFPAPALPLLSEHLRTYAPVFSDDFSSLLLYQLLRERASGYAAYPDVTEELSNRLINSLFSFTSWEDFCQCLKTKELTYSRISRCLTHILLGIRSLDEISYGRILGLRKDASPLLSALKKNASLPLISKAADAKDLLPEGAYEAFCRDLDRSQIYEAVLSQKSNTPLRNELQLPFVAL